MAEYETTPEKLGMLIRTHESQRVKRVTGALVASVKTAAAIIRSNVPVASSELKNSIDIEYTTGGIGEVVVRAPHAMAVEVGSRPHMPPIEPLMVWAQLVKHGEDPRDVAWRVALKIKREGIKPTWFVRNSLSKIVAATQARVTYSLQDK